MSTEYTERLERLKPSWHLLQINSIYGPMTNLLANKRVKLSSGMRIVRILEFIKSEVSSN